MGLRSWLTPVASEAEAKRLKAAIRRNPDAYGVHYVIDVRQDVPLLPRGPVVAWSGDGNWSLTEHMPAKYHGDTVLLDDLLEVFPAWHEGEGPARFGKVLEG